VITERDHATIQARDNVYTRNDSLLHCLSSELTATQFEQLLLALEQTGQQHVANFVRGDGGLLLTDDNDNSFSADYIGTICSDLYAFSALRLTNIWLYTSVIMHRNILKSFENIQKKLSGGCWHGYLSGVRCRFAYGPADATCHSLSLAPVDPDWFTFLVLSHPVNPRQFQDGHNMCVCVCACRHLPLQEERVGSDTRPFPT